MDLDLAQGADDLSVTAVVSRYTSAGRVLVSWQEFGVAVEAQAVVAAGGPVSFAHRYSVAGNHLVVASSQRAVDYDGHPAWLTTEYSGWLVELRPGGGRLRELWPLRNRAVPTWGDLDTQWASQTVSWGGRPLAAPGEDPQSFALVWRGRGDGVSREEVDLP
jgi:hypothetical protein